MTTVAYEDLESLLNSIEVPVDEDELQALECDAEGLAELQAEFEIYLEDRRQNLQDLIFYFLHKHPGFLQQYCGFGEQT